MAVSGVKPRRYAGLRGGRFATTPVFRCPVNAFGTSTGRNFLGVRCARGYLSRRRRRRSRAARPWLGLMNRRGGRPSVRRTLHTFTTLYQAIALRRKPSPTGGPVCLVDALSQTLRGRGGATRRLRRLRRCWKNEMTTLGGGSLGSCVDEERSQLRELM